MQLSIMNKVKNGELSIEDALHQAKQERKQLLQHMGKAEEVGEKDNMQINNNSSRKACWTVFYKVYLTWTMLLFLLDPCSEIPGIYVVIVVMSLLNQGNFKPHWGIYRICVVGSLAL